MISYVFTFWHASEIACLSYEFFNLNYFGNLLDNFKEKPQYKKNKQYQEGF